MEESLNFIFNGVKFIHIAPFQTLNNSEKKYETFDLYSCFYRWDYESKETKKICLLVSNPNEDNNKEEITFSDLSKNNKWKSIHVRNLSTYDELSELISGGWAGLDSSEVQILNSYMKYDEEKKTPFHKTEIMIIKELETDTKFSYGYGEESLDFIVSFINIQTRFTDETTYFEMAILLLDEFVVERVQV